MYLSQSVVIYIPSLSACQVYITRSFCQLVILLSVMSKSMFVISESATMSSAPCLNPPPCQVRCQFCRCFYCTWLLMLMFILYFSLLQILPYIRVMRIEFISLLSTVACGGRSGLVSGYLIRKLLWKIVPSLCSEIKNKIGWRVYQSLKA